MQAHTREVSITVALVLAGAMMAFAYFFSGPLAPSANAGDAEELLRSYAAQDTDADGLPDWQEAVYGTDKDNPQSVQAGMTDAEAVRTGVVTTRFSAETDASESVTTSPNAPKDDTVTGQFSRDLFGTYLLDRGETPPTEAELATYIEEMVETLSASRGTIYDTGDLRTAPQTDDAYATYLGNAEAAFAQNTIATEYSELIYFSDALQGEDAEALVNVKRIGAAYENIARAFAHVPAPAELGVTHLELANALSQLGAVIGDLAMLRDDPVRAFVGLRSYENAATRMRDAFIKLHAALGDVEITAGDPGYSFFNALQVLGSEETI